MLIVQIVVFLVILALAGFFMFRRIKFISRNIKLGLPVTRDDHSGKRWKTMFLIAFGQKKMFKRIIPAFLHLLVYVGFVVINIEVLEFIIDGLTGQHRIIGKFLNTISTNASGYNLFYNIALNVFEFMAMGVFLSCLFFLIRRNILKVKRFSGTEMTRWPLLDANLILIFEIILVAAILKMNAADQVLQGRSYEGYIQTGPLLISKYVFIPFLQGFGDAILVAIERITWWFHILGILGFAIYVTYSKHLHIFMAFPNTYFSNLLPPAQITNMEAVMLEVKSMLGMSNESIGVAPEEVSLGARDVTGLTWKNLMEAYTCTECGRCTSVCPANITGKVLSPRKVMMDVRDRMEEVGINRDQGKKEDGKSLFNRITREEIFACTTCNACIEICPVNIDPVSIIMQMRRYTALEESSSPNAWNMMFNNVETNFAPWKFPASDRFKWSEEISIG